MISLPIEIILNIFETAAIADQQTAGRLCVVSRAAYKEVVLILYKKVCLSSTKQVKLFNTSLEAGEYRHADLIQCVTLLDRELTAKRWEVMNRFEPDEDSIVAWTLLAKNLVRLSRAHQLKTLVLSEETCRRVFRSRSGNWTFKEGECLVLDHLVISHQFFPVLLSKLDTKKITVYWSEYGICYYVGDFIDFIHQPSLLRSRQLRKVKIMIYDNYKRKHQVPQARTRFLVDSMRALSEISSISLMISIKIHCNQSGAVEAIRKELESVDDMQMRAGTWGSTNDLYQKIAEMNSLAENGWIRKWPCIPIPQDQMKKIPKDLLDKAKEGAWLIRPPPEVREEKVWEDEM